MTRSRSIFLMAALFAAFAHSAGAQTFVPVGPTTGSVERLVVAPSSTSTVLAIPGNDAGGLFLTTNAGAAWTSIAAGICDAHVRDAVFHPTTASTIYVATMSAGVCRSTDSGATWTALTSGLPTSGGFPREIDSIAINPSMPTTLLAGTTAGVYRSTDGGATWTSAGLANATIRALAISPSTAATAYAMTSSLGMQKSVDSGATWTAANTGLGTNLQGFISIDPTNANVLYITTDNVYKTSNGGGSWAASSTGLGSPFFFSNVAIDPGNPNTLYVNAIGGTGFARSTDGGGSWSAFSSSGIPTVLGLANVFQFLAIDPATPTRFYVGTPSAGAFRSTDSGANFTAINTDLDTLQVVAPALIPGGSSAASLLVAGRSLNDGSDIYKLTAGALPFSTIGTPLSADQSGGVSAMAVDPTNASIIYVVGGKQSGQNCAQVYKSTDGGSSWTVMASGIPTNSCGNNLVIDPTSPSTLYLSVFNPTGGGGTSFVGVYKSTNGGSTWTGSSSGLGSPTNYIAISPLHTNILYAATASQVFRSSNSGGSWSNASSGLPTTSGGSNAGIRRLAIDPTNDDIVYAGAADGVYRTANAGGSWSLGSNGWPTLNGTRYAVGALAVNPTAPTTLYATPANPANGPTSFLSSTARGQGLFKSTDSGGSWTAVTGSIAGAIVNDIAIDANRAAFASTNNGVFKGSLLTAATVTLSRTSLRFAATSTGGALTTQTAAQTVRLTQGTGSTVTWTATSDKPWLVVSPASGSGGAALSISVQFDSSLPASGTVTGSIAIALTNAANTVGPISVSLTIVPTTSAASPPFGVFDTPVGDATVLAGSVAVTGWALDNIGINRVEIWRDLQAGETTPPFNSPGDPRNGKVFIANGVFVDGARPDVEAIYASTTPFAYRAGWGYLMLTWGLANQGNGTYKLYAFAFDQENNVATLGTKTIIVSNAAATRPFGSIDTPAIGGDASGFNFGWGLTPLVSGAATCKIQSNGVQVSVDSGPLQPVIYGDARGDIASAFPGFSNSAAAGGHFHYDWSTLTNGAHTIGWLITDDCGRADGVGSRFFNVTTGTNLVAAPDQSLVPPSLRVALPGASASLAAQSESDAPITVARGYGELPEILDPGTAGSRTIELKQGERIEVRVPRGYETALQVVAGQARALPTGANWDAASGTFAWQPAAGFLGLYRIVFSNGSERISVRIVVVAP